MRIIYALTVAAVAMGTLAGCGAGAIESGNEENVKTLAEVKAETWALQDEIAAKIPSEYLAGDPVRAEEATLIDQCDGENQWRWPGAWEVEIDPTFDTVEFMGELEQEWSQKQGWSAGYFNDGQILQVTRDDGSWFSVFSVQANARLHIGSNSACFQLDSAADPAEKY